MQQPRGTQECKQINMQTWEALQILWWGEVLSPLQKLVINSWKVYPQGWEIGELGACISSAARGGMGRMSRGGHAER